MPIGLLDVITRVLSDVRACASDGVVYDSNKAVSDRLKLMAVTPNSVAALLFAELSEDGAGIRRAHEDVLFWLRRRRESGEKYMPYWGLSSTYPCYLRMNQTVTVVQKLSQGSDDPNLAW